MSPSSSYIRPYTEAEYAVLVLLAFVRLVGKTDSWLGFVPPRSPMHDIADRAEVRASLQYAIDAVREVFLQDGER